MIKLKQLDMFLDNLFKTDVNTDIVVFWTAIVIGILISCLISVLGCQLEDIMLRLGSKIKSKKKRR